MKSLPNNRNIEIQVIASLLHSPGVYETQFINLDADLFYDEKLKTIFRGIEELKSIDPVLIAEATGYHDLIAEIGEAASHINITPYIRLLWDLLKRRKLFIAINENIKEVLNQDANINDILSKTSAMVNSILNTNTMDDYHKPEPLLDLLPRFFQETEDIATGKKRLFKTGIEPVDEKIGGFMKGEYVIIAGRPSSGKTSFALQMALYNAAIGNSVLYFSLETIKNTIAGRMLFLEADQVFGNIFTNIKSIDVNVLGNAGSKIMNYPIWIDDTARITADYIARRIESLKHFQEFDLVFIDHIQLMGTAAKGSRNEMMSEISAGIKYLTQTYYKPIIALSQLSRKGVGDKGYEPSLHDLRDSGTLEQDADRVYFIHRPNAYDKSQPEAYAKFIIAKNKTGYTGYVGMDFNPKTMKFREESQANVDYWQNG